MYSRELASLGENARTRHIRSRSILGEIPSNRSCEDIGMSMHYCSCELDWRPATLEMKVSRLAFKFAIDYINNLLKHASNYCAPLRIFETQEITYAPSASSLNATLFKVKFLTMPNNGLYSVMLKFNHSSGFSIDSPASISRTNPYGFQPKCLESLSSNKPELMVDLRKFCLCKRYLKNLYKFQ